MEEGRGRLGGEGDEAQMKERHVEGRSSERERCVRRKGKKSEGKKRER